MESVTKELLNYGVLGVTTIGLILGITILWRYIKILHVEAKEEREKWQEIAKDGQIVAKEHTSALIALKTLLETTRERH